MKLSQVHPIFYHTRVWQLRWSRRLSDRLKGVRYARTRAAETLPHTVKQHQSWFRRQLAGTDPIWQENKIVNLALASAPMDGLLIRPGETFSFWQTVGDTTKAKGYLEGMEIWEDKVVGGIGGGVCQLANLLYWLALHTPLEVVERHHHSFDPFPDHLRVLPWGTGASVFYNYVDLRFYNPTQQTFQLKVWLTPDHLKGALYTEQEWPLAYRIEERNHRFFRAGGKSWRENEVWRRVTEKRTGVEVRAEQLMHNLGEVKYELPRA